MNVAGGTGLENAYFVDGVNVSVPSGLVARHISPCITPAIHIAAM